MSEPVRSSDVVVGMLTENTPRMLAQALRLLRSIRWFGGALAQSRIVVCSVGELATDTRTSLELLGAETRVVSRFHPANPTANRHQLIAELLDAPQPLAFLLDCDTIVMRDPLPFLTHDGFQAKVAPTETVNDEVFERLFAHFGMVKPPRTYVTPWSGIPTIPYFNAGVFAIPTAMLRELAPSWRKFNLELADNPHLAAPCTRHIHQASLSLALAETGIPTSALPEVMNYQLNATHVDAPPGFAESDPVIIHYHHLGTDDGYLLPTPYPAAQKRIDEFHARLREEGIAPQTSTNSTSSRPIVVLGMHRSGTSVVTELVSAMGSHVGGPDELIIADMFNPNGYWEHREVVKIDIEMLEALKATWTDNITAVDVAQLTREQRDEFLARAKNVVATLQSHGSFVIKDPRMALLFPLWREALDNPICVIAWRDPLSVARSLWTRDKQPVLVSLAVWEHYTRTLLRDTAGLQRVLVSYEELLSDPEKVARELHAALGIAELRVPSSERIRQMVNKDFNRSGPRARTEESLLDPDQRALLDALRSGDALRMNIAPTPARALELLAEHGASMKREAALRGDIVELDALLDAVFSSRSWKLGHHGTAVTRVLRRHKQLSAYDRWQQSRQRRKERGE